MGLSLTSPKDRWLSIGYARRRLYQTLFTLCLRWRYFDLSNHHRWELPHKSLLPPAYVVRREVMFSQVCVFSGVRGTGPSGPRSLLGEGWYPCSLGLWSQTLSWVGGGGTPVLVRGWGYLCPRTWLGTPPPGPVQGTPYPSTRTRTGVLSSPPAEH